MNWGYKGSVADFLDASESSLLGFLSQAAANSGFFEQQPKLADGQRTTRITSDTSVWIPLRQ